MKKTQALFCMLLLMSMSCTKYRDVPSKVATFVPPSSTGGITFGSLRINEFICKGSAPNAESYLGSNAKWFELYNPTEADITLTAGQWFVTDTLGIKTKFAIPQNTGAQWKVPAKGYLAVMCLKGGASPSATKINASFSLSSTVGAIGIYYQESPSAPIVAVDTILYNFGSGALSGVSYGRKPDGQGPGNLQLSSVTPEATNN